LRYSRAARWAIGLGVALIAIVAALIALNVGERAWKAFRDRRSAPAGDARGAEPTGLTPDAFPQRVPEPRENRYAAGPLEPTADDVRRLIAGVEFDDWYGVYRRRRKIGFGRDVMRRTARGEPGAYFSSFDMAMRAGFSAVSYEFDARYYSGDAPFRLLELKTRSKSRDGDVLREFSFGEHDGRLTETVDGVVKPVVTIPATKETLAAEFATNVAGPERVKLGQTATLRLFDAELLKDDTVVVTVTGVAARRVAGIDLPVATLSVHTPSDNLTMTVNVAQGGRSVDVSMDDVTLRPEPRAAAIDVD
jgi:hypothetical protein